MSVYGSNVQPANVSVIIRLQNLPLAANASDVRAFLAGLAIPDGGVHIVGGERGDAFIAFSNDEDARQAIFRSGRPVKGVPVSLQLSSRAEMQRVIEEVRRAAQAYELQSRGDDEPLVQSDAAAVTASPLSAVLPNILTSPKALSAVGSAEGRQGALPAAATSVMNAAYGALATVGGNAAKAAQLQPPIISLTKFLGAVGVPAAQKAVTAPSVAPTKPSSLITATVAPAAATATAAAASTVSPLALPGGSSYQEIPGLSLVGGSTPEASSSVPALNSSGIASWLSAISEQLQQTNAAQQRIQPAAMTATTPMGATNALSSALSSAYGSAVITSNMNSNTINGNNSTMPFFGNGQPIVSEGPWKTLQRDSNRRSRSSSRDRHDNRSRQEEQSRHPGRQQQRRSSRSSSRERRRRSLSSSRERGGSASRGSRKFRSSRSSSRERWSRSSSREPPSAAAQRQRQRRSRSASRDRFGRTRSKQRSRSRSRDRHRSSRDSSRERNQQGGGGGGSSGGGTRDSARSRWDRPERSSRFSDRDNSIDSNPSLQQWNSFNNINANNNGTPFTGTAAALQHQPVYTGPMAGAMMATMNQVSEPIFGLHTMTALEQQQRAAHIIGPHGNMIPARSGKITPPPTLGGPGAMFRSTSPLPESVYAGRNSSDYAVKIGNLAPLTGYGDIRRYFHSHPIATQGIKMINDEQGRRTGVAYVQFSRKEGKTNALRRNGARFRDQTIQVESITDQEFELALDSSRPSGGGGGDTGDRRRNKRVANRSRNYDGNDEVIDIDADQGNDGGDGNGGGGGRWQRTGGLPERTDRDLFEKTPTTALKVRNLPTLTTEQDIMKMFSDFTVVEVLIVRNHAMPKQLDGYIRFHRQEDAREAWSQTHRHYIANKRVMVRLCSELDYAVAKNEYENPVEPQQQPKDEQEEDREKQQQQQQQMKTNDRDRPPLSTSSSQDDDVQIIGEVQGSTNFKGMYGGDPVRDPFQRSVDWSVEKNWDEEEENMPPRGGGRQGSVDGRDMGFSSPSSSSFSSMQPQQGAVGRDPRLNRDPRMNRFASNSDQQQQQQQHQQNYERQNNGIEANNELQQEQMQQLQQLHLLQQQHQLQQQQQQQQQQHDNGDRWPMQHDPRRMNNGNSNDSSELFQRTNCLLLRNVVGTATERDVYEFFAEDGFRAKNVQLVMDEWGCRTGEAVVQFDSASEAAHAESKSSQMLGNQTVFASHLDRGQVAELMQRFDAQDQKRQELQQQRHSRDEGSPGRSRSNGGRGSENDDNDDDDPRSCMVGMLNLAYKTTVEDVQRFFREYRLPLENIKRLFMNNGKATGEALVRFRNPREARRAIRECNNQRMFGRNVRLRIVDDATEPRSRKVY